MAEKELDPTVRRLRFRPCKMQPWTPSSPRSMRVWRKKPNHFGMTISDRKLDSWTPADLLAAAELANNQLYITVLRKDLRKEERVRGEDRNEGVIKQLRKEIVELQRTILAQRRDLQIHSHATNGESRDQKNEIRTTRTHAEPPRSTLKVTTT